MRLSTLAVLSILLLSSAADAGCQARKSPWVERTETRKDGTLWVKISPLSPDSAATWRLSLSQKFSTSPSTSPAVEADASGAWIRVDDVLPKWFVRNLNQRSRVESNCKATAYALSSFSPAAWSYESMTGIGNEFYVFEKEWKVQKYISSTTPDAEQAKLGDWLYYRPQKTSDHMVTYLGYGLISENNSAEALQKFQVSQVDRCLSRVGYGKPLQQITTLRTPPHLEARESWIHELNDEESAFFHHAESTLKQYFEEGTPIAPYAEERRALAQKLYRRCKDEWMETKSGRTAYSPGRSEVILHCFKTLEELKTTLKLF